MKVDSIFLRALCLLHNTSCVFVFQPHSNIFVVIFLKCYTMKWVTTPQRRRSVVVVMLSFGCTIVRCHVRTQKELFSLHSNIKALDSVHLFCLFTLAECSCVRSCLDICHCVPVCLRPHSNVV